MLTFDAETAKILGNAYRGADFTRRRQASFDALSPGPGETILDIGCGNGALTEELARAVGPDGRIIGIDPSPEMRAAAAPIAEAYGCVTLMEGDAGALPVPDASADKAASVQVFEYVADVDGALAEAHRALRPGGRLVIADLHFGTLVWHSDDPARMARMVAAWDAHFVDGTLPATLPGAMRRAGFAIDEVRTITLTDWRLKSDGMALTMMHLMRRFAIDNGLVPEPEAEAWFAEQEALAREGRFFFSLTQFVTIARAI